MGLSLCFLDYATNYTFIYGIEASNDSLIDWQSWEDSQSVKTFNKSLCYPSTLLLNFK